MSNTEHPKLLFQQMQEIMRRNDERKAREVEETRQAVESSEVPLPDGLLQRVLRLFPTDAESVLQGHAGFVLAERRDHYKASLSIMYTSLNDLDRAIGDFENQATSDETDIMLPRNRGALEGIERQIQKELFSTANAAASLVDHVRRFQKKVEIPNFDEQLTEYFGDDGLNELVLGLRVLLHHLHIVRPDWSLSSDFSTGLRTAGLNIKREELERAIAAAGTRFSGTNGDPIRNYLSSQENQIDLRALFADYRKRLSRFYDWFNQEVAARAPDTLTDYDRCVLEKVRYSSRMMWNALIGNWLNWDEVPNFHNHLPKFLNQEQLDEVYALARNSEQQADLIISMLDKNDAADQKLRERVYDLFQRLSEQEV